MAITVIETAPEPWMRLSGTADEQWGRIANGITHLRDLQVQVMRKALLPRAVEVGQALCRLRQEHYPGHGDGARFEAHAREWTGLGRSQLFRYMQLGDQHRLLREYVEQHGITDQLTSITRAAELLQLAQVEQERLRLGGAPDAWSSPGQKAPDRQPAQLGEGANASDEGLASAAVDAGDAEADADDARHRAQRQEAAANAAQLKAVMEPLWKLSASPALRRRPELAPRLVKLAKIVEATVDQVLRALELAELSPEQIDQHELQLDATPSMPVVISCPEQIDEAQTEVIVTSAHLTAEDPTADAVIPGDTATIAAKAAAKDKTKKVGVLAERYPNCRESLARLEYDAQQAGGHQFLADAIGCSRSAVSMRLKDFRRKYG